METGLTDPMTTIRINMHHRLTNGNNKTLIKLLEKEEKDSWAEKNGQTMRDLNIREEELGVSKEIFKIVITMKVNQSFKTKTEDAAKNKSKALCALTGRDNWQPGQQPKYMREMTRNQVSTIFKARTRMLDIKANYKNKYPNQTCRICRITEETQEHVLAQCSPGDFTRQRITKKDLFDEVITNLTETAKKIEVIMEKLTY